MKTTTQKLTDKLCECEAVREDIRGLRFGCKVLVNYSGEIQKQTIDCWVTTKEIDGKFYLRNSDGKRDLPIVEIIGKSLELRHIMMYCEDKDKTLLSNHLGYLWTLDSMGDNCIDICKIDNTLPFHEQSEETLKLILDFLNR